MKNVVSYSGWIGNSNLGDEALYLANKRSLPELELVNREQYNESDILLFGGGTVMPRPDYRLQREKRSVVAAIGVGTKIESFRNRPFAPIDIDYILNKFGATGILGIKGVGRALGWLSNQSDLITQSSHCIDPRGFETLRQFDYVGVRGPVSESVLRHHNVECRIVGDTALVLEPSEYHYETTGRIAVNLRSGRTGLKWTNDSSYVAEIISFCESISEEYEVVFMPFHPADIPLHIRLAESIDNATFRDFCSQTDVQGAIDELSACDMMIGERLHAAILSACVHTPFLSLGYQPKHIDFVRSVNMGHAHVRIDQLTENWLHSKFDGLVGSNEAIEEIEHEVEEKRTCLASFIDEIAAAARGTETLDERASPSRS